MEAPRSGLLVNGVLKGGDAKGIAYAGALKAVEERGVCFGVVAVASAGAITAAGGLLVFISMKLRRFVRRSGRVQELLKGHGR